MSVKPEERISRKPCREENRSFKPEERVARKPGKKIGGLVRVLSKGVRGEDNVKKSGKSDERVARKPGKKIEGSNQRARAWNKPRY